VSCGSKSGLSILIHDSDLMKYTVRLPFPSLASGGSNLLGAERKVSSSGTDRCIRSASEIARFAILQEGNPQAWRDVNYAVIIMWGVRSSFVLARIVVCLIRGTDPRGDLA
jgi:hypothetical protein